MKIREAIEKLSRLDPEADLVNCSGEPLWLFEQMPGYWDGSYDRLILTDSKYYNIAGIQIGLRDGNKVKARFRSCREILFNDSDAIVLDAQGEPSEYGEEIRQEVITHEKAWAFKPLKSSGDKCKNRLVMVWENKEDYEAFKVKFWPIWKEWRDKDRRCYQSWYDSWFGFLYYDLTPDMIDQARYTATGLDCPPEIMLTTAEDKE